jgi:hypothetical protein
MSSPNAAIASTILGRTTATTSWPPAATKPAMSRATRQPARSRAVAICVHSRAGSLSEVSSDIQATFAGADSEANHWATTVVLPYPAGAAINVTGRWVARLSSSSSRTRTTHSERAGGGRSLASKIEATSWPLRASSVVRLVTCRHRAVAPNMRSAILLDPWPTLPGCDQCRLYGRKTTGRPF